ncbi:SDR family oxidoreductase [Nocardia sp. 2]|uniref:SDR family oxidoreductase n=1 Tax=Nocardia acididurans TaxID=2802282 RepID=A0ABS1M0L3_9NOCA|nr:SDR family oxidoreductase [Nocardia acididurans]MBL1073866.1 SDR family oxidoreductase [Nocardia acididurans]
MTPHIETRERFVRNGEIDLAVYEQGTPDGPTIVLVHGWPDSHRLWDNVIPHLADRFHLVTYDSRGHGRSTVPADSRAFRISELATDLFAVIDAVSPDAPVHVLAHDWGSVTAWDAVCEPDAEQRIASFTSVSGPNLDHAGRWARRRFTRPTPGNLAGPLAQLASVAYQFAFMSPMMPPLMRRGLREQGFRLGLRLAQGTPGERVTLADTFAEDAVNGLGVYRANLVVAKLFTARERHTKVPVQLIVAKYDPAVRPSVFDDEQRWTDQLWRRDLKAGHWVPYSHPEALAQATIQLIDAVSGGAQARELRRAEVGRRRKRDFDDHLVVVTGAGSGIGRETALAFARAGAEVVVSDIDPTAVHDTASAIAEFGGTAFPYQLDVADEEAVRAHAEEVARRHGVPDVVVNNAGVGQAAPFLRTPSESFRRVIDINLFGVVNGSRAFGKLMAERGLGGHIVNVSSMAAYTPQQGFSAYSTSKSAVFMFSDCLRAELASAGIGVTTVCPGIVHTNIVRTTEFSGLRGEQEEFRQQLFDTLYRLRRYPPSKVATAIVRAVRRNRAVVPVTPEAWAAYYGSRLTPPALMRFGIARASLAR